MLTDDQVRDRQREELAELTAQYDKLLNRNVELLAQREVMLGALYMARGYVSADEHTHGRKFETGDTIRAAIDQAEKESTR